MDNYDILQYLIRTSTKKQILYALTEYMRCGMVKGKQEDFLSELDIAKSHNYTLELKWWKIYVNSVRLTSRTHHP